VTGDDEQPTAEFDEIRDPDLADVPSDLQLLAGLGPVTVMDQDGVGPATLVIVPALFAHARRLREED
jgi:hypothetical protein